MINVSNFNLKKEGNKIPTVKLNSGYFIPVIGLGTYGLSSNVCVESVKYAISKGCFLFDTAHIYNNEIEVGKAIKESNVEREKIFVITKIYPGEQFLNPEKAIEESLNKLNIGYIDMMLLHHPGSNDVKAYRTIEKFVKLGKIKSIGLSNWYIEEIDNFISQINILPSLIQNEIHPYYQEQKVVPYMQKLGIVMQGWYPFGGREHIKTLLTDNTLLEIAKNHNVTTAQVILRWNLQRGIIAIPSSSNQQHILENLSVFNFELSESEMKKIALLDRNQKYDWY
ncbi:MAG: aldo/keto reductase [Malacoplasma sp.]|nr:aldo/keto reductase [Malacoplasma sp.]MDE6562869.1 aldo/keto reductase [Malacoplasma sp.]